MKTEELDDLIKQVYFYCENKDPNGLYPDRDIDLREFASKLLAVYEAKTKVESQAPVCSLLSKSNK
jgi:hypothetical protein